MRPKPIVSVMVCVLIVGGAAMLAAPEQTQQPGQMTQARVLVLNRGRNEAVPVDLRDANLDSPLHVRIMNGEPNVAPTLTVRLAPVTWDYKTVPIAPGDDMAQVLHTDGSNGWETTGITYADSRGMTTILLKRAR
ncbi:MAG TPA: hypothetical protein VGH34_23965 [Vicinamibacterales bacterium]|jgi:hypothetical protein